MKLIALLFALFSIGSFAQLNVNQYFLKEGKKQQLSSRYYTKGELTINLYDYEVQLMTKTSGYGDIEKKYPIKDIKYLVHNRELGTSQNVYTCRGEFGNAIIKFWMDDDGFLASVQDGMVLMEYSGEVSHYNYTKEAQEHKSDFSSDKETPTQVQESPISESPSTKQTENNSVRSNSVENNDNKDVSPTFSFGSGNSGQGSNDGADSFGDGVGGGSGPGTRGNNYNPNRKVVKIPNFDTQAQEEGTIAMDIWVDERGNIIKTRFKASKSTSGSAYLIKLAEKAARTMKYDAKAGAPIEYVGYKLFKFKKI